VAAAVNKNGNK